MAEWLPREEYLKLPAAEKQRLRTEYISYKKKVASQYEKNPEGTYTVDIPGIKDIFIYQQRKSYNKQLKYERYQRFKTKTSPIPEALNWVPGVINQLDDAQDIMYTAMVLAKPLLRRLPSRFIPFVGWGLLLMDIINLATKLLSMSMTPGLTKPCLRKNIAKYKKIKKLPLSLFRDFLSPGGWRRSLAFWLQAPQATLTLTGYGLQLGAVMGTVSDSIWGGIRAVGGAKVTFRAPPPSDPASKAARFLSQGYVNPNLRDILEPEEHVLLLAAHQAAVGILLGEGYTIDDSRANELMGSEVAVFEPWELSTIEMLEENGWDPFEEIVPFTNIENPTYGEIMDDAAVNHADWEKAMHGVFEGYGEEHSSVIWNIYQEAAHDMIKAVTGVPHEDYTEDFPVVKSVTEFAGCGIMPWRPPAKNEIALMLEIAYVFAEARGAEYPECEDYKKAGEEIFGRMVPKDIRQSRLPNFRTQGLK